MNKKCILLVLGLLLIPGVASVVWRMEALAAKPQAKPQAKSGGPKRAPKVELISPIRLAIARNGLLLVSDSRTRRIVKLNRGNLGVIGSFEVKGKPIAVAADGHKIYVGNTKTHRVEVYGKRGQLLYTLGGEGYEFQRPIDIAIDRARGHVFVVDGGAKLIEVFDVSTDPVGTLLRTIPAGGADPDVLTNPTAIAVDTTRQEVIVSDYGQLGVGSARVQIFDYAGNHLKSISGKAGMMGKRFSRPQGLAVDCQGHIFLVDCFIGRVLVLNRNTGRTVKSLGTYGRSGALGEMALPLDVVVDPRTKDVFVTNNRLGRIEVFVKGGLVP